MNQMTIREENGERKKKRKKKYKVQMNKNSLETNNCNKMNEIQDVCIQTIETQSMLGFFRNDERPLFFLDAFFITKETKKNKKKTK